MIVLDKSFFNNYLNLGHRVECVNNIKGEIMKKTKKNLKCAQAHQKIKRIRLGKTQENLI